jgi:hypothetical protein
MSRPAPYVPKTKRAKNSHDWSLQGREGQTCDTCCCLRAPTSMSPRYDSSLITSDSVSLRDASTPSIITCDATRPRASATPFTNAVLNLASRSNSALETPVSLAVALMNSFPAGGTWGRLHLSAELAPPPEHEYPLSIAHLSEQPSARYLCVV